MSPSSAVDMAWFSFLAKAFFFIYIIFLGRGAFTE